MSDFQKGDIVETNENAREHLRLSVILTGRHPDNQSAYYRPGEKARVVDVGRYEGDSTLIEVEFTADGTVDNIYADCIDLVYRPINDPSLYERSLLDLVEAVSHV